MVWEALVFGFLAILGIAGIGVGVLALNKANSNNDTRKLTEAITLLENKPYVDPAQIKEIISRLNKLDNVITQQGQVLAIVKKSAFQAEEVSKKLAVVYNQTAANKI